MLKLVIYKAHLISLLLRVLNVEKKIKTIMLNNSHSLDSKNKAEYICYLSCPTAQGHLIDNSAVRVPV